MHTPRGRMEWGVEEREGETGNIVAYLCAAGNKSAEEDSLMTLEKEEETEHMVASRSARQAESHLCMEGK